LDVLPLEAAEAHPRDDVVQDVGIAAPAVANKARLGRRALREDELPPLADEPGDQLQALRVVDHVDVGRVLVATGVF
jgi:hypothetical protein